MKSPHRLLIVLLALTTIGGAMLSWRQYQELVELRATAMNRDERADLQKKVWDLEKSRRELDIQLAGLRAIAGADPAGGFGRPGEPSDKAGRRDRGPSGPGGRDAAALQTLLARPDVQALLVTQQKATVEARYAALFPNLNLAPEQLEKFKALLADRGTTMLDLLSVARDQGIDPRSDPEGFRQLMKNAKDELDNGLKAVLGEAGFAQYQAFEATQAQRAVVSQLQQRLSYTDTPLTSAQADQMIRILAANAPAPRGTAAGSTFVGVGSVAGGAGDLGALTALFGVGGGPAAAGGGSATISAAAVNQAQPVLSGPQFTALQQLQQQQNAQAQLQQLMRDTLAPPTPGRIAPPAPAPSVKKGGG